jgi:protein phosphatase
MAELHPKHQEQAQHPSRISPHRNILTNAVGTQVAVQVDTTYRRAAAGDSILLCSDGLWELVLEYEMEDIIRSTENPQEACSKLISLAKARGGTDNISAIIVKFPKASA